MGGDAEFKERISRCLAPTLAQFAVAAGNDAQWKPLNYQVLLKTRDKSSVVRIKTAYSLTLMLQTGILGLNLLGHFVMFISKFSMHLTTYNPGHK